MAAAALASCTREPVSYDGMSEFAPNTIAFSLESAPFTKAGQVLNTTTVNLGEDATGLSVTLQETVTWLGSNVQTVPSTKGAPVTDADVAEKYGSFKAIVYDSVGQYPLDGDEELSGGVDFVYEPKHDKWAHTFKTNPFNRVPNMTFWMFMPEVPTLQSEVENLKGVVTKVFNVEVKPDILDQKDILIAGANLSKTGYVPALGFSAHFFHIFVGVRFKLLALDGNTKVEKVTLEGLSGRGNFEFDNRTSEPTYGEFTWSPKYTARDITNYSFIPATDIVSNSETPVDINNQAGDYTFWLIPQALSVPEQPSEDPDHYGYPTDVYLKLEVSTDNNRRVVRIKLNDALGGTADNPVKWVAGELHTITLELHDMSLHASQDMEYSDYNPINLQ